MPLKILEQNLKNRGNFCFIYYYRWSFFHRNLTILEISPEVFEKYFTPINLNNYCHVIKKYYLEGGGILKEIYESGSKGFERGKKILEETGIWRQAAWRENIKLERLKENPRERIGAHPLHGRLKGKWSCWLGSNIRIIYSINEINNKIIIEAIGSHKIY